MSWIQEKFAGRVVKPAYLTYGLMVLGTVDAVRRLCIREHKTVLSLSNDVVARSSWVPTHTLFLYRLFTTLFCIGIMAGELITFGVKELRFFTQWSFLLLVTYFIFSTYTTWQLMANRSGKKNSVKGLNGCSYFLVVAFHISIVATCVVDVTFWFLLYPGAMREEDPIIKARHEKKFHCIYSHVQHGFNAALLLGELALNDIPYLQSVAPWFRLWCTVYGLWVSLYHHLHGAWLYPFVDLTSMWTPIFHIALELAAHIFGGLHRLLFVWKMRILRKSSFRADYGARIKPH